MQQQESNSNIKKIAHSKKRIVSRSKDLEKRTKEIISEVQSEHNFTPLFVDYNKERYLKITRANVSEPIENCILIFKHRRRANKPTTWEVNFFGENMLFKTTNVYKVINFVKELALKRAILFKYIVYYHIDFRVFNISRNKVKEKYHVANTSRTFE